MALKNCKDCGNEVSGAAASCPKCGAPLKARPLGCGTILLLCIVGIALMSVFLGRDPSTQRTETPRPTTERNTTPRPADIRYAHQTINIRDSAGTSHEVIGQLQRGDNVVVTETIDDWVKVRNDKISEGHVYAPLLKMTPLPALEISSWNWRRDPNFGTKGAVIWNVEVRNNTNGYIERVRVEFSTYDKDENLITSDFTYVRGLSPGGTASSKAYATYFGREQTGRVRITRR